KLRVPGKRSPRSRVVGPSGSAATLRIAAARMMEYRRLASGPQRWALVARMCARSMLAGPESRKRAIALARGFTLMHAQSVEEGLEFGFVDFNVIPTLEGVRPGLDLLA